MRARYYEPASGRFVTEDAVKAGWNYYSFCHSDPVNFVDGSGNIDFYLGDYNIRLDRENSDPLLWDLHIKVTKTGEELISMAANGTIRHHRAANVWTKDIVRSIMRAAGAGHANVLEVANLLRQGFFGFSPDMFENLIRRAGLAIIAFTSVEAYAQLNPMDFLDLMITIGSFGRN